MINIIRLGNVYGEQFGTGYAGNVWDKNGLCPTIKNEGGGGGRVPMIIEKVEKFRFMDNGIRKHQSNTVYNIDGLNLIIATVNSGETQ